MKVFYKTGNYWRQIVQFLDVNACDYFHHSSGIPIIKRYIDNAKKSCPFLPSECPFKVGKYYGNQTIANLPDPKTMTHEEVLKFQKVNLRADFF
jgi:hypothetical protein